MVSHNLPSRIVLTFGLASGILPTAACNQQTGASAAPTVPSAPLKDAAPVKVVTMDEGLPDPVARIGDQAISLAELNKAAAAGVIAARQKEYEARQKALDDIINDKLLEAEAKKQGISKDDLLKKEVDDKVKAPTEAEIEDFYNKNKSRMRGATLDKMHDRLKSHLTREAKADRKNAYLAELRKKANVEVYLAPPRIDVDAGNGVRKGPEDAPVQIIEFSDFQCPYCARARNTLEEIEKNYGDKVSLVYRHFPLPFHSHAHRAAEAAWCARDQGKFWEYHDKLFDNQGHLEDADLEKYATDLGLDGDKFKQCLEGGTHKADVDKDIEAGKAVGMTGTPGFYINGRLIAGAQPYDNFKKVIDSELANTKSN